VRKPRVVVVGAGFAGLAAVRRLARSAVEVTLLDRNNFHTFQPLLYQVATAGLGPGDVAYPVRTIFRRRANVRFVHAAASGVNLAAHEVNVESGGTFNYDYLVVATGATAATFGVPGVSDNSFRLYTLEDARRFRNHVLSVLERADVSAGGDGPAVAGGDGPAVAGGEGPAPAAGGEAPAPVFVIVGGGPTGVETAGALVELLDTTLRHDRLQIDRRRARVVLVDALDGLLMGFPPRARRYAQRVLERRGVEVRLGTRVSEVRSGGVRLSTGEEVAADAVVWVAGVTVEGTLASSLGAGHGTASAPPGRRVKVQPDLSLEGHPEVFVVGDAAAVPPPRGSGWSPQVAQVAIQTGGHAARQILADIEGQPRRAFRYRDKGMMATVGRRAAVAWLRGGLVLRGTPGWLAWLGLHLVYLIGFRNRAVVLVNWAWRYFRWPSGPRLIFGESTPAPVANSQSSPSPPGDAVPA
jgi:NADH dehydrogenase